MTATAEEDSALSRSLLPEREAFTYSPLPDARTYIRLLKVMKEPCTSQLHAQMIVCRLSKAPKFVAISYTWGSAPDGQNPANVICIDAKWKHIWPNCHYALSQAYRLLSEGDNFWIDSICINQTDLDEKAAQVQMIASDIFARATFVLASLGPDEDGSDDFFAKMLDLHDGSRVSHLGASARSDWSDKDHAAFKSLASREYWRRLWILPELYSAGERGSRLILLCGSHTTNWESLAALLDAAHSNLVSRLELTSDSIINTPLHKVGEMIFRRYGITSFAFTMEYLALLSDWKCTDPRDRFYAIWSIVNWSTIKNPPKVDYTVSGTQLALTLVCVEGQERKVLGLSTVCSDLCELLKTFRVTPNELASFCPPQSTQKCDFGTSRKPPIWKTMLREHSRLPSRNNETSSIIVDIWDSDIATIVADGSGGMTVPMDESKPPYSFEQARPNVRVTYPKLTKGSITIGWLCPNARIGDQLLKLDLGHQLLYLVLRRRSCPYRNRYGKRNFEIIGRATVNRRVTINFNRVNSTTRRPTYFSINKYDLLTIVTPAYLVRDFIALAGTRKTFFEQPAIPWPKYSCPTSATLSYWKRTIKAK